MANKKYFWLRLKRDFFKRHDIKIVEAMPNGKDYILFYLKLLVESVDHEGMLRFSDTIPYSVEMLSALTNTNVDVVRSAMEVFTQLEMIDILDDATIFMREVDNMIGSCSADEHTRESTRNRVRAYREREKQKQISVSDERYSNVTERYSNVTCNGESESESESDINNIIINNNIVGQTDDVIDYLNLICSTKYQKSTPKTRKLIQTRLKEGFTVDDFKTVIDKKYAEWHDTKMSQYLRPETLFGTKFEGYLNQVDTPPSGGGNLFDQLRDA